MQIKNTKLNWSIINPLVGIACIFIILVFLIIGCSSSNEINAESKPSPDRFKLISEQKIGRTNRVYIYEDTITKIQWVYIPEACFRPIVEDKEK